jgi:hypothetical protein
MYFRIEEKRNRCGCVSIEIQNHVKMCLLPKLYLRRRLSLNETMKLNLNCHLSYVTFES